MRKATFTLSFRRGDTVAGEVFVMSTEHGEPEQMLYWSESGSDGVWDLSENSLARLKDIIKFEDDFAVEPEEIQ